MFAKQTTAAKAALFGAAGQQSFITP